MLDFDSATLSREVEMLAPEDIDRLPFGVVKLDDANRVTLYSSAEGKLSGYGDQRPVIGRLFFSDIAPCMSGEAFLGRIKKARERGALDLRFNWIGDFADREREIRVRIQSASGGGLWLFLQRSELT